MNGHKALKSLILKNAGMPSDLVERLTINLTTTCEFLKIDKDKVLELPTIVQITGNVCQVNDKDSVIWNYVCCGFHVLIDHIKSPNEGDVRDILSVSQQKNIRTILEIILMFGLVPNLIPGVGVSLNARSQFVTSRGETVSTIDKYIRLRTCTAGLLLCNNNFEIRKYIISRHLGDLLAALFQLSFAPLKKSILNEDLWEKLQADRILFQNELNHLLNTIYPPSLIKEIMILMGMAKPPAPRWLKSESSKILCDLIVKKDGILSLSRAMFESDSIDTGAQWKHMGVFQKLIFDIGNLNYLPNFYTNICNQILKMLLESEDSKNLYLILPRLFCKSFIERRKDIFEKEIFDVIINPLNKCTQDVYSDEIVITESEMKRTLKCLYQIFAVEINSKTEIQAQVYLVPYIDIIFQLYSKLFNDNSNDKKYSKAILVKVLNNVNFDQLSSIINLVLFRNTSDNLFKFGDSLEIVNGDNNGVYVRKSVDKINYILSVTDESFQNLISELSLVVQAKIFKIIFSEFCNMFSAKPIENVNLILLKEDENYVPPFAADKLFSLKILSYLAEKKSVMDKLDISILIKFISKLFKKYENSNTDQFENAEGLFLSLMLLDILIENSIELDQLKNSIDSLEALAKNTSNTELKTYIINTCLKIRNGGVGIQESRIKSPMEQALDEICDPLLPIRAHGLMSLTKLIETKDKDACARKQYILCIFQENLKDTDSYIYLTAINGIAALSTAYTDSVIDILTEEYVSMKEWRNEEEHQRIRMNLGEVLVRVTKNLGEMVPKYKAVLLNTFLFGTKDYDNLIRTSSLSNLGQICEVLGYKLGSATTEILQCLDAIIETDKAIEARRAAVMVIYQLLKGFGSDTIICLKEALLPIYRKLKDIYVNEKDDTMRLHAQLALDELNNATRNFLLPPIQIDKNINIFI